MLRCTDVRGVPESGRRVSFAYVIGAKNEEPQLERLFERLERRLSRHAGSQVVIVENGSTDRTYELARALSSQVRAVSVDVRRSAPGLGNAVRTGIRDVTAEFTVVTAADLPFGFSDLDAFMSSGCPALATGSKNHPESNWPKVVGRSMLSRGFRVARAALFGLWRLDTQGSIFVQTTVMDRIADRLLSTGYFISTEIVVRARRLGVPVEYLPVSGEQSIRPSNVRLRDSASVVREMLQVRASL